MPPNGVALHSHMHSNRKKASLCINRCGSLEGQRQHERVTARRRKAAAQSIDRAPIEDADRNDLASLLTRSFRTWNHESTQAAGLWWRPSSLESEPSNVRR